MPVPNWILRRMTLPWGARLPEAPKKPVVTYGRYQPMGGGHFGEWSDMENGKPRKGNLANEQYEFYAGSSYPASDFASCRWCGDSLYSNFMREEHFAHTECSQMIKKAAVLLRRDGLCVQCDTKTNKATWGVPLCGATCVARFKFRNGRQTTAYEAAKLLIIKNTGWVKPGQQQQLVIVKNNTITIDADDGDAKEFERWQEGWHDHSY